RRALGRGDQRGRLSSRVRRRYAMGAPGHRRPFQQPPRARLPGQGGNRRRGADAGRVHPPEGDGSTTMNRTILCAVVSVGWSAAAPPPQGLKGIETADLDRGATPCEDFYQSATGAGPAANPIPPSMDRWSRRWKAAEQSKEQLRDILEELSRGNRPEGGVEQLGAEHYASCMDGQSTEAAGDAPLKPDCPE